jgi:hypothetical protein
MTVKPLRAVLAHRMPGRARLRIQEAGADEAAVLRLGRALAEYPAVHEARANVNARSILILHTGELAPILADAESRGLLSLASASRQASTPMRRVQQAIENLDARVLDQTEHGIGLGSIAFAALAVAGVWQTLNGRLLPAGTTLFNYALGVMQWGALREQPTSESQQD